MKRERLLNKKETILHLIHSGGFYGAEAVVLNLSIGLLNSGFHPIIGCFWDRGKSKPELGKIAEEKGIDVHYIHFNKKIELNRPIKQIKDIVDQNGVKVINSHGYKPSFFCLLMRLRYEIQYVITCHLWIATGLKMKINVFIDKLSMIFAKKIIAVSNPIAKEIKSWNILKRKVYVINNGIDIEEYATYKQDYSEMPLRKELGLSRHSHVVGTLGRLTDQKAHHIFIKAAQSILRERNDVEFILAGEGPNEKYLKTLCKTYSISKHFHFIGYRSDAINILQLLDVFILCSIDEGLPIVVLEAMSVGKPIVATDVGEIPKIISNNLNGILIKKNDIEQLACRILQLLDNEKLANDLALNAKQIVQKNHSIEKMCSEYISLYQKV